MSAPSLHSNLRIHRHLVEEIIASLHLIFAEGRHADKVIERALKAQRKWGSRDRRFFAENVYECVRWWRKLWFLLGMEPSVESALLWRLWGAYRLTQNVDLPQWPELQAVELQNAIDRAPLAVQESIPDWLDLRGRAELGERWPSILKSLNQKSTVDLRVNTLKATRLQVQAALAEDGIETSLIPTSEEGLQLIERKNVFITPTFLKGWFEVQDRASQQVALLLNPQPGERVIDACAGAGGKSLHLAARMKNKGRVISLDVNEKKLQELVVRARRNGVSIIETRLIESTKTIKRLSASADRLLLDVPCSGLGVLRRNPGTKWQLQPETLEQTQNLQREILQTYSQIVKPGGTLVYATCSCLPSENEDQIKWFLIQAPGFDLVKQVRIDPDQNQGDGFFAAAIKRKI